MMGFAVVEDETQDALIKRWGAAYHVITHRLTSEDRCQFGLHAVGTWSPRASLFCTAITRTYSKETGGEFRGVTGVVCATQSPANE